MTVAHKTYPLASFKALPGEGEGTFEAVVSVFGNVDYQGDRVMPGAFEKSIEKWQKKGDPLPVVWSHNWGDPFAHIGYVDPSDMKEIKGNQKAGIPGGLYVKGHLDVHKPFAKQVFDLLAERRVTEHSFSYDIPPGGERRGKDGANELLTVDLIEIGPTMKGANPDTVTLGTKSDEPRPETEDERRVKARLDRAHDDELRLELMKAEWNGDAAMRSCHSAADFRKIAFERANDSDPDTAAHWALPHHSSPGAEANPAGVAAALAALHGARGGAPDLKNKAAAESHLQAHSGAEKAETEPDGEKDGNAQHLIDWFNAGADGAIAWGSPGDWAQCVAVASAHMGVEDAKGFCQNRHQDATGMSTAEHAHNEGKTEEPDGAKAGRMIGSAAASTIKEHVAKALDECFAELNDGGSYTEEKLAERVIEKLAEPPYTGSLGEQDQALAKQLDELARVPQPDPKPAPSPEPSPNPLGDKKDYARGYADATTRREPETGESATVEYVRGFDEGSKDRDQMDHKEISDLEAQFAQLEIKRGS